MGTTGFPKKHLNTTAVLVCKKRSTFKESLIVFIYVRTYIYFIHIYIYTSSPGRIFQIFYWLLQWQCEFFREIWGHIHIADSWASKCSQQCLRKCSRTWVLQWGGVRANDPLVPVSFCTTGVKCNEMYRNAGTAQRGWLGFRGGWGHFIGLYRIYATSGKTWQCKRAMHKMDAPLKPSHLQAPGKRLLAKTEPSRRCTCV